VDYLGITKSKRVKNAENTYIYQKSVAEELRGWGILHGFPVWSAVQTNKNAYHARCGKHK
jgi:hypothetical protein